MAIATSLGARLRGFLGSLFAGRASAVQPARSRFAIPGKNLLAALKVIKQDEWLYVGLRRIADGVMFAPWHIESGDGRELEDRRQPVIGIFEKPNPLQRWPEFIETLIMHWLPSGSAYILMDARAAGGAPTELWVLRPDRVTLVAAPEGSTALFGGYEYTKPDGSKIKLKIEDVIRLSFADPENPFYGMGIVEAMPKVFETDIAAADYARDFFRNGADAGTVLSTERVLDEEVRKAVLSGWDDAHLARRGRAHSTALLEGGLKVTPTGTTPKESAFLETRKAHRESILGALGVQPLKAGITEGSNRATAFIQERSWQRDTITPLLRRLAPALSVVAEQFGPFKFAFEDLVVEDNEMDSTIATAYLSAGAITPNEIREHYAGLPPVKGRPEMDQFYLPVNLLPIGEEPAAEPGTKPGGKPTEEPGKPALEPVEIPSGAPAGRAPRGTALQRRVLAAYVRQRTRQERIWRKEVGTYFRRLGAEIAQAYAKGGRDATIDLAPGERIPGEVPWKRLTRNLHDETMTEQYEIAVELFHIDEDEDFKPGGRAYEVRARRLAQRVENVPQETKDQLDKVIQDGLAKGLSPSEIAHGTTDGSFAGIEGLFEDMASGRAQLIARTESAAAMDQANTEAYRGMGVDTCDVIGCEDEVIVEGQTYGCNSQNIPIDEAESIEFHPNHKGAIVPRVGRLAGALSLTAISRLCYHNDRAGNNGRVHAVPTKGVR